MRLILFISEVVLTMRKCPNTLVPKICFSPSWVVSSMTCRRSPPVENNCLMLLNVGGQKAPQLIPVTGMIPALQYNQSTWVYLHTGKETSTEGAANHISTYTHIHSLISSFPLRPSYVSKLHETRSWVGRNKTNIVAD